MMKNRFMAFCVSLAMLAVLPGAVERAEIDADAAAKTLNIVVNFGTSETSQYGVPNEFLGRYNAITNRVSYLYSDKFSIKINFSKPTTNFVVTSPADTCKANTATYDAPCYHASYSQCSNNGPLHHTNSRYIKNTLFPAVDPNVYGMQMHITAVEMCYVDNEGQSDERHLEAYGMAFRNGGFIVMRDYDYTMINGNINWQGDTSKIYYTVSVMAHEIGHLYLVDDHYDEPYGDARDYCIWGYYKDVENVANNSIMCSDCRAVIQANSNRFNF